MKWPRGKYNGQKIVGIEFKFKVDITFWRLLLKWNFGEPYFFLGPFRLQISPVYLFHSFPTVSSP